MAAAPNDRNDRYSSDYQYDAPNVLTAATDPVPVSIPLDALYSSLNSIEAQRSDNNNNKKMEKMKKSKEIQKQKNHFNTISAETGRLWSVDESGNDCTQKMPYEKLIYSHAFEHRLLFSSPLLWLLHYYVYL